MTRDRVKDLFEEHIKEYDGRELEVFRRNIEKHLPQPTGVDALVEKISEYMHDTWSNWYKFQRDYSFEEQVARREKQSETKYKDLSEEDKEKDRKFAREILSLQQPIQTEESFIN